MDVVAFYAFRWSSGIAEPIEEIEQVSFEDLLEIEQQKRLVRMNIEAFIKETRALNMLLWGERGCGKSSLIKATLNHYKHKGLRVVELTKSGLEEIYPLYNRIRTLPEYRFVLLFDDISFDNRDDSYRRFKSILEGGIEKLPENIIFVATSNMRLLTTNRAATTENDYSTEEINEQMSLFERFGLIVSFHPFNREQYLSTVEHYLKRYNMEFNEEIAREAENYASLHASRSARTAKQFALFMYIRERYGERLT